MKQSRPNQLPDLALHNKRAKFRYRFGYLWLLGLGVCAVVLFADQDSKISIFEYAAVRFVVFTIVIVIVSVAISKMKKK